MVDCNPAVACRALGCAKFSSPPAVMSLHAGSTIAIFTLCALHDPLLLLYACSSLRDDALLMWISSLF
jgi:hypothetical protein